MVVCQSSEIDILAFFVNSSLLVTMLAKLLGGPLANTLSKLGPKSFPETPSDCEMGCTDFD